MIFLTRKQLDEMLCREREEVERRRMLFDMKEQIDKLTFRVSCLENQAIKSGELKTCEGATENVTKCTE